MPADNDVSFRGPTLTLKNTECGVMKQTHQMPQSVDIVKCHQLPGALDATGRLKVTQSDAAYSNVALAGLTWATDVSISPLAMTGFDNISFSVELDNASGTASAAKVTVEVSCDGGTSYFAYADVGSSEVSISGADSHVIRGSLQGIPGAHIQFTNRLTASMGVKSPFMVRRH